MFGVYGQVVTRGLLNAMIVVASIQLLRMGQSGTGLLNAALGFGGLAGAIFAMTARRSDRLVPHGDRLARVLGLAPGGHRADPEGGDRPVRDGRHRGRERHL